MEHKRTHIFKNTVFQETNGPAKTVFSGPGELEIGSASEFGGSPETLNPEEMFVAAINGCIMTTFFYFAEKLSVKCSSYFSEAEGQLEKQSDGFRFTNVKVRARVQLPNTETAEKTREAGQLAEKYCLVSRSVSCRVDYQLQVGVNGK
jgi:organic hydroperoxide reductase OsmC/OhrA